MAEGVSSVPRTQDPYHDRDVEFGTFAVVTCAPKAALSAIHDRMPVIIAPEDRARWLDASAEDPAELMRQYPSELVISWPVTRRVGSVRNNTPDLLDTVTPDP